MLDKFQASTNTERSKIASNSSGTSSMTTAAAAAAAATSSSSSSSSSSDSSNGGINPSMFSSTTKASTLDRSAAGNSCSGSDSHHRNNSDNKWACPTCTYLNDQQLKQCEICGSGSSGYRIGGGGPFISPAIPSFPSPSSSSLPPPLDHRGDDGSAMLPGAVGLPQTAWLRCRQQETVRVQHRVKSRVRSAIDVAEAEATRKWMAGQTRDPSNLYVRLHANAHAPSAFIILC